MTSSAEPHGGSEKLYHDRAPRTSESDSDVDNDPATHRARSSGEVAEHDRELLEEEAEREDLLTAERKPRGSVGLFGTASRRTVHGEKREQKSRGKRRRRARKSDMEDEDGYLMYEMEEGGPKSDVSSQASSSSFELDRLNMQKRPISRRRRNTQCIAIAVSIAVLFVVLAFGAYRASHTHLPPAVTLLSNGSSTFAPTTILISLDGFRADFLQRGITPTLNQFIAEGVSPKWMLPSFPSVTFPNHYTLVTGLYPESHGVVGNTFWDPDLKEELQNTDPARSMQPKWWSQAEPLWVTAEKQNVRTAIHMWPGSEAGMDFEATYLDKFNMTETLPRKTERILELLDLPSVERSSGSRPQLIAAYVPNVDSNGHKYGPNSTEVWDTISDVDKMLHHIFRGLDERNLTDIVNVVVVSDHGMATTSTNRTIQLDDLIDLDIIEHIDGWPHYGLRPKNPVDIQGLYDRLNVEAERSQGFDVYLRDADMPEKYHFSHNDRIAPLWIMPKTGWAIVTKDEFDVQEAKANGEAYHPKGLHGYDHENPLMRAIFVARGPAFPHKPNSRVEAFQNIEVYNIICDSLGIEPEPNNGTLRLPLKPVGLHSDDPKQGVPADPVADEVAEMGDEVPATDGHESEQEMNDFWAYMKAKMKAAMKWANNVVGKLKAGKPSDPDA